MKIKDPQSEKLNKLTGIIIESAMIVHSTFGAGLLESVYKECLKHELEKRKLNVQSELYLPVIYDAKLFDIGYRIDLLVDSSVIVEVKALSQIAAIHRAQLLTYLKLSGKKVGLLLNFNAVHLKDGIVRLVNGFPD